MTSSVLNAAKLPANGGGHDVTKLEEVTAEEAGQDGEVCSYVNVCN